MKNAAIALLLLVVVVLGHALVRVENERYALSLGMCEVPLGPAIGSMQVQASAEC